MVILRFFLPFFLLLSISLEAIDVTVTAEVDSTAVLGQSINGSITVTHFQEDTIDPKSFRLGEDPLTVEFVRQVQISPRSPLVISIYRFTFTQKQPGLHVLPEISVAVGGKVYRSIQTTYEVERPDQVQVPIQKRAPNPKSGEVILFLEEIIEPSTVYIGQHLDVGYRFRYNYSIDLLEEVLPLLSAEGFTKVGAKKTREYAEEGLNVFEVKQKIQAKASGEFPFEKGTIRGRAYRMNLYNQKEYAKGESVAETSPATITVLPFPTEGRPPSFNGAIGESYTFTTSLLSSPSLGLGDKLLFKITISGKGDLDSLPMPKVCCQPGFSGFFRMSDIPPVENLQGDTKTFVVEMRPLTTDLKQIPSLAFAFFNPKLKQYQEKRSNPIPITVSPTPQTQPEASQLNQKLSPTTLSSEALTLDPIEIEGNLPLNADTLTPRKFSSWLVLFLIPAGAALVFLQWILKKTYAEKKQRFRPKQSEILFKKAMKQPEHSPHYFGLLEQALITRLWEKGEIDSVHASIENLPDGGAAGEVKILLQEIEEKRFSREEECVDDALVERAEILFLKLRSES